MFTAADEHEARRVIEEDPLYRTGSYCSPILCCAVGSPGSTKDFVPTPQLGNAQQPKKDTYFLTLQLSPAFMDYLWRPGVIDEIDASRREGRLPSVEKLKSLGLPENFSRALIERLGYLRGLHDKRIMRAARPFPGLKDAVYVFMAGDEQEARRNDRGRSALSDRLRRA